MKQNHRCSSSAKVGLWRRWSSFACYVSGDSWVDRPAHLHHDGCTISYADGHAMYWKFADPRTITIDFFANTPNNPDLQYIHSLLGI
ncbi:MAG TPA: hypothetical protein VFE47_02865 [Tepidisphaeraceae bacterium]|nr:hypothetical protein [Tepidisphaeraceae bacterium]